MMVAFRLATKRYACTCRPGRHEKDPTARKAWGCDGRTETPAFADPITGSFTESSCFDLHRCPAGQIGSEWDDFLSVWSAYGSGDSRGPLPLAGGWLDQMQWFTDAHAVMAAELDKYREIERKKSEADAKSRRGKAR